MFVFSPGRSVWLPVLTGDLRGDDPVPPQPGLLPAAPRVRAPRHPDRRDLALHHLLPDHRETRRQGQGRRDRQRHRGHLRGPVGQLPDGLRHGPPRADALPDRQPDAQVGRADLVPIRVRVRGAGGVLHRGQDVVREVLLHVFRFGQGGREAPQRSDGAQVRDVFSDRVDDGVCRADDCFQSAGDREDKCFL